MCHSWNQPQLVSSCTNDTNVRSRCSCYPTLSVAILNHFLECHDSRIPVPFEGKTFQTGEKRPTQIKNTHTQKHGNWGMASATPLKSAVVFFFQREVFCCGITPLAWDGFAEDGDCSVQKKHLRPLGLLWKCKPPTILNNHIVFHIIFPLYRAIGDKPSWIRQGALKRKKHVSQALHLQIWIKIGAPWGTHGANTKRFCCGNRPLWYWLVILIHTHLTCNSRQATNSQLWSTLTLHRPILRTWRSAINMQSFVRGKDKPTPQNLHTWHFVTRFNHFFQRYALYLCQVCRAWSCRGCSDSPQPRSHSAPAGWLWGQHDFSFTQNTIPAN